MEHCAGYSLRDADDKENFFNIYSAMSETLQLLIAIPISWVLGTLSLAASLWIMAEREQSPFQGEERVENWIKCAAIVLVAILVQALPGLLGIEDGLAMLLLLASLVVWIGGLMVMFNYSFFGAVLLSLVNAFVMQVMVALILFPLSGFG